MKNYIIYFYTFRPGSPGFDVDKANNFARGANAFSIYKRV